MASSTNAPDGPAAANAQGAPQIPIIARRSAPPRVTSKGPKTNKAKPTFIGEARFRSEAPEKSSLRLKIDTASLAVTGQVNEKDRREMERTMHEDVLETASYPEILFEGAVAQAVSLADGLYRIKLSGRLTLHGITRELEVPANVTVGADGIRANGEFTIRQTDYRIRPVSAVGGTIKLKDELRFTFDIVGNRRQEGV
jgi:polyisoprenoid-binding protein YceI